MKLCASDPPCALVGISQSVQAESLYSCTTHPRPQEIQLAFLKEFASFTEQTAGSGDVSGNFATNCSKAKILPIP